MGSFGRITSKKDLPDDKTMISLIHQAMELNDKGLKVAKKPAAGKKELVIPKSSPRRSPRIRKQRLNSSG
jgi:hypothetical protein